MLHMIPDEIFHYTTKEKALEKILFERKIKLGQIRFTNDPRESKERLLVVQLRPPSSEHKLPFEKLMEIDNQANDIVLKEWKVFCVSQHHPEHDLHVGEIIYPYFRGDCLSRMWAHYAGNYTGICLVFNGNKLDKRMREELGNRCEVFCGSISYDNIKSMLPPTPIDLENIENPDSIKVIREHCRRYWEELFLVKSKEWETEFEYRWLVHSEADDSESISIDGVVSGILAGHDFPEAYVPSLIAMCKELRIPAGKVEWQRNGIPHINNKNYYDPDE